MAHKIYSSGSGSITALSLSSYGATANPDGNAVCSSGSIIVGQQVSYNRNFPPGLQYTYFRHKGYVAFDTARLAGFLLSGNKVFSASLNFNVGTFYYDQPWNLNIKSKNFHHPDTVSGFERLPSDLDADDFVSVARADWSPNCDSLVKTFSVSGWTAGDYKKFPIPQYWLVTSGLSEFKLSSDRADNGVNTGWATETSAREVAYMYGFTDSVNLRPFLMIGLAGMKYLRLTDISLYYFTKSIIEANPTTSGNVNLSDGYPLELNKIELPKISIEHIGSEVSPLEVGPDFMRNWKRDFIIDIFARTDGELKDLSEMICEHLEDSAPLYDYNGGFPDYGYTPNRIGTIYFSNDESRRISPENEHPATRFHQSIILTASTDVIDPDLDVFNIRIDAS